MLVDLKFDTEHSGYHYKGYEIYPWYSAYDSNIMYCVVNATENGDLDFDFMQDAISYIDEKTS